MSKSFPLVMATVGEQVRLESISGGGKLIQRLTALGLTPGVDLSVVQDAGGPLLISVRDSRTALGRGMGYRVIVSLVDSNGSKTKNEGEKK